MPRLLSAAAAPALRDCKQPPPRSADSPDMPSRSPANSTSPRSERADVLPCEGGHGRTSAFPPTAAPQANRGHKSP